MGNERCITISSSATVGTAASLVDDSAAAAAGGGVGAGVGATVGETVGASFGVGTTGLFTGGFDERTVVLLACSRATRLTL